MGRKVPALISDGMRRKTEQSPMLLGVDLMDAREEVFCRMVTDGISMGVAFMRAGFKSKHTDAPYKLWSLDRIQERAAAILEARRTTGVVTLPQVTSMLQRVFSSAYHADEYNAAHNAALSLARLYGHVNDRQTLEVIRRPSRDPDAPSEQELSSWVESLPAINAPDGNGGFSHSVLAPAETSDIGPLPRAPAPVLSHDDVSPTVRDSLAEPRDNMPNEINWLAESASDPIACDMIGAGGRPENGAPVGPVTGTPNPGGHSPLLGKRVPRQNRQVPGTPAGELLPKIEDLF